MYTSFANEREGLENEEAALHQYVKLCYTQTHAQRTRIVCVLLPCRETAIVLVSGFI